LVDLGACLICEGCGKPEDVKTYQFDIDLPMINACQLCIMSLADPKMADRLEMKDSWSANEP
jgi:hypothetical protein